VQDECFWDGLSGLDWFEFEDVCERLGSTSWRWPRSMRYPFFLLVLAVLSLKMSAGVSGVSRRYPFAFFSFLRKVLATIG
jgi:hypothetical protein